MRTTLAHEEGELEVELRGEQWTVRLGELEESSLYLDFALSKLLDDSSPRVHQLAAQIVERLLVEAQTPNVVTTGSNSGASVGEG